MNALVGNTIGKYRIIEEIGRGGMAAVYKAWHQTLERYVAIKVLAPHLVWEEGFVERFLREARTAARLKHPNIVTIGKWLVNLTNNPAHGWVLAWSRRE